MEYTPGMLQQARLVLEEVQHGASLERALRRHPNPEGGYLPKHALVAAYRGLVDEGEWEADPELLRRIRMKPVRTLSGVTTVTALTKPTRSGRSSPDGYAFGYLPDEPGARRGLEHNYDPYGQVASRLQALKAVGHPTDKVELLILGGSWCAYRRDYHEWYVSAVSMHERVNSNNLEEAQAINETAPSRNVGLVIETRPTDITPQELRWLRSLGVTKVQMGAQSLDDRILALNQRGHSVADTRRAVALLRAGGFKIGTDAQRSVRP
jgi:elongator complex protein 3